jgi:hypothetical protein
MGLDKDLVLEFVFYFSRFEYALKREGYIPPSGDAKALWDPFVNEEKVFIDLYCETSPAARFILEHPPQKQIVRDKKLLWIEPRFAAEPARIRLFLGIRAIRNNLFHGGKFPEQPISEVARNIELIDSACRCLKDVSMGSSKMKKYFESADLEI